MPSRDGGDSGPNVRPPCRLKISVNIIFAENITNFKIGLFWSKSQIFEKLFVPS